MSTDPMRLMFRDAAEELTSDAVAMPVETVRARAARATNAERVHVVRPVRPRWQAGRPALTAGLAAVALACLLVFQTLPGPNGSTPAAASAAAVVVLERAAEIAVIAGSPPSPGRYMLVESTSTIAVGVVPAAGGDAVTYLQDETRRTWTAVDGVGEGLVEVRYGKITWLNAGDQERLGPSDLDVAEGDVRQFAVPGPAGAGLQPGETSEIIVEEGQRIEVIRDETGKEVERTVLAERDKTQDPRSPTYARLLELPTDPGALYVEIVRDVGSSPQDALDRVGLLLAYNTAPPDVRAALYLAATRIPGVSVVPDEDGLSKTVVLGVTGPFTRNEITLDTDTGVLVGRSQVTVVDDAFKGAPSGTTVFTETRTAKFADELGSA